MLLKSEHSLSPCPRQCGRQSQEFCCSSGFFCLPLFLRLSQGVWTLDDSSVSDSSHSCSGFLDIFVFCGYLRESKTHLINRFT